MAETITFQTNQQVEILVVGLPTMTANDLVYTLGGGSLFPNLVNDLVDGGKQWHSGNTLIDTTYSTKDCSDMTITTETQTINSPIITKGLFQAIGNTGNYLWDEVYTTPLGSYLAQNTGTSLSDYQFYINNNNTNELFITINDVNILPKIGDFLFLQIIPTSTTINNTSYTDGINSLPVIPNSEVYTFYITQVNIQNTSSSFNTYKLVLDKSIQIQVNKNYLLVLLNRKDTGIQKELFYDTFEQIEVVKTQLLGDPYDNISDTTVPLGRKNYLNYTSSQYLGLSVLLKNIINNSSPFIVYDISNDIKDRFLPQSNTFSFVLPFVMVQEDNRTGLDLNKSNVLVNSGAIQNEITGIGRYSALFFSWDTTFSNRKGWIFYDLRIVVIDEPELSTALSYNANRNYTLPRASTLPGFGNDQINTAGGLDLSITNVSNTTPVIITTSIPHNLAQGTPVFISNVYVRDSVGNIIPGSANGYNYVKSLIPNDPFSFALYDATLTVPVAGNGEFFKNPNGSSGEVKGTETSFSYFYTYRVKSKHYTSTLPFSQITDFNFALNGKVSNNSAALLQLTLPKIQWLQDATNTIGFEALDLEIIIGEYLNADPTNPQLITGISNIVSIPISSINLTYPRTLFDMSGNQTDFSTINTAIKITKQDYDNFVALINSSIAPFNSTTGLGNTNYDIINNFKHYIYANGDPVSPTILTGNSKWTLGNLTYRTSMDIYRSNLQLVIPADKFNDTTNPSYDSANSFITDRYISEIGIVLTDTSTNIDVPMIYAKIAPAVRKTNILDIIFQLKLDF